MHCRIMLSLKFWYASLSNLISYELNGIYWENLTELLVVTVLLSSIV